MNKQRGFTLIELVVVIIILGVLAAVAVPKFVDMSTEAKNAAAKGVAGALSSSTSINYAARQAGNTTTTTLLNAANVCLPATLNTLITGGVTFVASGAVGDGQFNATGTGDCTAATGAASASCLITASGSATGLQSATAIIFCAR